jgi:hypothetical protein
MHTFSNDDIDLFLSDDLYAQTKDDTEEFARLAQMSSVVPTIEQAAFEEVLHCDVLQPLLRGAYENYIRQIGQVTGKTRLAIVHAHGGSNGGEWTLRDGDVEIPLQPWIDARDGDYACIAIVSCNVDMATPRSARTPLFVPDRSFTLSRGDGSHSDSSFTLVCPFLGELDEYTVGSALEALRAFDTRKLEAIAAFELAVRGARVYSTCRAGGNDSTVYLARYGAFLRLFGPAHARVSVIARTYDNSVRMLWHGTPFSSEHRNPVDEKSMLDYKTVLVVRTNKRHAKSSTVANVLRDAIDCSIYKP